MKKYNIILLLFLFSNQLWAQSHWESIILEDNTWTYFVPTEAPSSDWVSISFDDNNWLQGPGGFGYADEDDNTTVPVGTSSVYMRKTFNIRSGVNIMSLLLDIDYDDAFVAYLNGDEVARSLNLAAGEVGLTPSVSADHEAIMYSGGNPERIGIDPTLLVEGNNILAVQIINISSNSSDLSGRVFLNAQIEGTTIEFNEIPNWFQEPVEIEYSSLPIIVIDTEGKSIPDEPKIMAKMKVVDNENKINYFNVDKNDSLAYDGFIGIEIRGNTAQTYPKKSYTVETRNEDESNNNVSLFGMPAENDWVLHGPYADKSLMRNALAYYFGNNMSGWHPRTQFVEVVINSEYRGVYLFVEKIKIDQNRVDIATLKEEDIEGDELTGGYIMSIDRQQEGSFNSPYPGRTGTYQMTFSYIDPKYDELNVQQREYIKNYIFSFEDALHGNNFIDPELGYRNYIDVESFIDYFFITEISRDIDGYRVSVFFHKDKDSNGGKLTMTPFWDYNLCFGNANFYQGGNTVGWAADGIGAGDQGNEIPFWWDKFKEDPYWQTTLKYRWEDLRQAALSNHSINTFIDSCYNDLMVPANRNFNQWNILNSYVWPNVFSNGTYEEHVEFLRNWVLQRMEWLDEQFEQIVPAFEYNNAPTAHAGSDFSVKENTLVTLTGTGDDPDGDELTYKWEGPEGVPINDPFNAEIQFMAPEVDTDSTFTFKLTVNDGKLTDSNKVKVTVLNSTSTESFTMDNLVKVYPNPAIDQFYIQFYSEVDQNINISISTVTGQKIYGHTDYYISGNSRIQVNRSELKTTSKLLFYKVEFENQSIVSGKIIVH
ncbi:MAG: CotH kinase family protein [Prolixibacteraceae bacterium]